jgi:putative glycosyltransferase (TIGR04348 family)
VKKASVIIVSPASPGANNGNERTAERWRAMLADAFDARVVQPQAVDDALEADVMLALHARKSSPAITGWAARVPRRPLAVVLTGTDLYEDGPADAAVRRSLQLADRLVLLQDHAAADVPAEFRHKAVVVQQSTTTMSPGLKADSRLDAVMVGHLRAAKAPRVLFEAARSIAPAEHITITHIGDASAEPALGDEARALQAQCPHYRWLGALAHAPAREHIRDAHVLVHTSILEGGAHVVMEAVCSGTPVIASRIPGNVGLLGDDYTGYFESGDVQGLVALLRECRRTQAQEDGLLEKLAAQCEHRVPLFHPVREAKALHALVEALLHGPRG